MMIFNPTQKELFNKNLNALNNALLKEKLGQIKSSKFEFVLGKDNLDINLKDISGGGDLERGDKDNSVLLYQDPLKELQTMLNLYNDKYLLYPVLYFYGFGNGILFKALLQNKHHKHIVVFEKDIEIIWTMFHILDFSSELEKQNLMLFDTACLGIEFFSLFCSQKPFFDFSRIYFLELSSSYYENFQEDVLEVNKNLALNFKNAIIAHGNDPLDALKGIEQFVYNLADMITHPSYKELLLKRSSLSDTAIIVSTGPSLTKQLPLLKKYANKATIFCADSAYPILAKNDIKPDYVCVLERVVETAEFFNKPFKEFDEGIVFILKSVVHPKSVECMRTRDFMISSSYMAFVNYVRMDKFGYFTSGFSVANMNYVIATHLMHKNIILIGQDLAYSDDGMSHPDGHVWGALDSLEKEDIVYDLKTKAYGGEGEVYTNITWNLFRNVFERHICYTSTRSGVKTYNCTEGGARIEGSIEKPFLWACENLLNEDLNKPFVKLEPLSLNKQNELMLKAYYKVCQSIKHCREFSGDLAKEFKDIQNIYLALNENEAYINFAIEKIDSFKHKLEDMKQMLDLYEILGPLLTQFELNLARIYVLNPKTKEDSFNKSVLWIKEHLEFMELVYGHIKAQENALIKNIIPLEEKLKERGLEKWMERVGSES